MSPKTEDSPSSEALAEARRQGAQAERQRGRRRLLIALITSATVLVAALVVGWVLVVQARDAAPEVISQMAVERRAALEQRLSRRSEEGAALAGEFFGFLQQVWWQNESLHQIRSSVGSAQAQLSLLDAEVRAALDAPLTQLDPLLENGPTRARQLAENLIVVAAEIRRLVPRVFDALGDAQQALDESSEGSTIPALIASMDALIGPFLGQKKELHAQWTGLKKDLLAWVGRLEADLTLARRDMRSEALGDEFLERMVRRMF